MSIWTPVERPGTRTARSWWFDAAVALAALAASSVYLGASPRLSVPVAFAIQVALALPLLVRRVWPVPAFAASVLVAAATGWWAMQVVWSPALAVGLYTVAVLRPRREAFVAAAVLAAGAVISAIHVFGSSWLPAGAALVAVVAATTALGLYIRTRRQLFEQLRERARRLQHERDQQATIAATAERTRIAREMHDIIAHHLTVMVTLSEGAAAQVASSPERAGAAMRTVSETGRQALSDTRRLLGVLRDAGDVASRTPQPDTASLGELVERVRGAGLTVRYRERGEPPDEPAVRLAVYRVVQEALTNTLRHGGPGATADVQVVYRPDEVRVEVTDDGGAAEPAAPLPGAGRGLVGMRERFEALGGRLDSGPRPPRGWQVTGRIEVGRS